MWTTVPAPATHLVGSSSSTESYLTTLKHIKNIKWRIRLQKKKISIRGIRCTSSVLKLHSPSLKKNGWEDRRIQESLYQPFPALIIAMQFAMKLITIIGKTRQALNDFDLWPLFPCKLSFVPPGTGTLIWTRMPTSWVSGCPQHSVHPGCKTLAQCTLLHSPTPVGPSMADITTLDKTVCQVWYTGCFNIAGWATR